MKYDDASWHYGGEFPAGLPNSAGATHIAIFAAWCVLNGLGGSLHEDDAPELLERLRAREFTPTEWFLTSCDEKFTEEDLSEEGNAFAAAYYGLPGENQGGPGSYLDDYAAMFSETPELYGVPDTWRSFDRIAPILARRLKAWRDKPKRRRWWPF